MKMLAYKSYEEAREKFTWGQTWELFDGSPEDINIGHESLDRHVGRGTAARIKFADGHIEKYTFDQLSRMSSQFANALEHSNIQFGDRVAIMLDPSLEFYVSFFGTIKRGAVVVPCYSQFGPEAIEYRLKDSGAKILITREEIKKDVGGQLDIPIIGAGPSFREFISNQRDRYEPKTSGKDVAVYQYTSGTTRKFPEAIKHYHRSIVSLMPATIFGRGLRPGLRFFCPSVPSWGHGLWHGTLAPLALGVAVGAYSGKFNIGVFLEALEEFDIENVNAAATVYRMMKNSGLVKKYNLNLRTINYSGEPMDTDTFQWLKETFGVSPISGYGSTEVGSVIYQYAGFEDWVVKPGSLGKPMPGIEVTLLGEDGNAVSEGIIGEIAVKKRGEWVRVKDAAVMDEDGYYWHKGRVDDVIISAGWTISPTEVEDTLKKHPSVLEAAVIGIPNKNRGEIVKAFILTNQDPSERLKEEIQKFVKERLSKHEYPREIEFVKSFPKTEGGKIKRQELRKTHVG